MNSTSFSHRRDEVAHDASPVVGRTLLATGHTHGAAQRARRRCPVIDALGAVRALPATMSSPLPAAARRGGWERYGIHGHELEAAEYAKARADLARRVAELAESEAA